LTAYLENQANTQLKSQLDNNDYDESQLISIKIPATHILDYTNSKLFERVDGQMEIKGVHYNYVKRRLYKDSVELLCIPNNSFMKIQDAKDEFFKLVNDFQHTGQSKKSNNHSGASKFFSIDNYVAHDSFALHNLFTTIVKQSFHLFSHTTFNFSSVIENPPEDCC
jgi:hypothetical protein